VLDQALTSIANQLEAATVGHRAAERPVPSVTLAGGALWSYAQSFALNDNSFETTYGPSHTRRDRTGVALWADGTPRLSAASPNTASETAEQATPPDPGSRTHCRISWQGSVLTNSRQHSSYPVEYWDGVERGTGARARGCV
jgi:hypothetical protein